MEGWIISMRRKEPTLKNKKHHVRKRALIGWMVIVPLLVVSLIAIIIRHEKEGEGIPRTLAVKSIVLALQSPEEFAEWQQSYKASHFPAKALEEWYVLFFSR